MDLVEKVKLSMRKSCPSCNSEFAADDEHKNCPRDQTPLQVVSKDPLIGTIIAERYELLERIGSGGWAIIYKARQQPLNRLVAIKVLHGHLAADPDKVRRFKREAEAATKLVHECVGSVFDYGMLPEGQPYIVMEYLDGITLGDMIKRDGKLPLESAVDLFRQICSGLQLAHERGIIHRDVKPNNIYLTEAESRAKILDFGLAKLLTPEDDDKTSSLTQTGQTIGTPSYMSPEQCMGFPLDARSDVYSVGCVMYEVLTGKRAFEGRNLFETMSLQLHQEPTFEAVGEAAKEIPADLQLIVMKTLAKEPHERFQSAKELDQALEAVFDRLQGSKKRHIWSAKAKNFFRKQKQLTRRLQREPLVAAVVTFSLLMLAGAGWYYSQPKMPNASGPAANAAVYQKDMADGQRQLDSSRYKAALESFKKAAKDSEGFGEADKRYLAALDAQKQVLQLLRDMKGVEQIDEQMRKISHRHPGAMYGDEQDNAQKIGLLQKRLDANPGDKQIAERLVHLRNNQAQLFLTASRFEEAQNQLTQALKIENDKLNNDTAEYATTLSNLAFMHASAGQWADAEQAYKQALSLRESRFGADSPLVARSLRNLGDFYFKRGDTYNAEKLLRRSLIIYQKNAMVEDASWDLNNLGLAYMKDQKFEQSRKMLQDALNMRIKLYGENGLDTARTKQNIGLLDAMVGDVPAAIQNLEAALRVFETELGPTQPDTLKCAQNLATTYMGVHDYKKALPLFTRISSSGDQTDPLVQEAMARLKDVHKFLGMPE